MAVRMKQYIKEFEKGHAKTGSVKKSHYPAAKKATVKRKKKKPDKIAEFKKRIRMILKGPKYETPATKRHKAGKGRSR